jgi:hypothetical protein
MLFPFKEQRDTVGMWLRPASQNNIMFKNRSRTWAIFEGWGGPLGSKANPPQTKPGCPDTWLSLLESRAWRCGTRAHAFSESTSMLVEMDFTFFLFLIETKDICI